MFGASVAEAGSDTFTGEVNMLTEEMLSVFGQPMGTVYRGVSFKVLASLIVFLDCSSVVLCIL